MFLCACRVTGALQELARQLAETIERDSKALVDDMCMYALGRERPVRDPPCARMSPTCSDEVRGPCPCKLRAFEACSQAPHTRCAEQNNVQHAKCLCSLEGASALDTCKFL